MEVEDAISPYVSQQILPLPRAENDDDSIPFSFTMKVPQVIQIVDKSMKYQGAPAEGANMSQLGAITRFQTFTDSFTTLTYSYAEDEESIGVNKTLQLWQAFVFASTPTLICDRPPHEHERYVPSRKQDPTIHLRAALILLEACSKGDDRSLKKNSAITFTEQMNSCGPTNYFKSEAEKPWKKRNARRMRKRNASSIRRRLGPTFEIHALSRNSRVIFMNSLACEKFASPVMRYNTCALPRLCFKPRQVPQTMGAK